VSHVGRRRRHTHPRIIGVYDWLVRRVNIHLDEELDAELAAEAARLGESKAEVLRRAAREWLDRRTAATDDPGGPVDPWDAFTGAVTGPPLDDRSDDEIIYGL
jgi:Arc/MetJ family transcription regulator